MMRIVLVIAFVLIAAPVVAGIAVLRSMDLNQYRALIAARVGGRLEGAGKGG